MSSKPRFVGEKVPFADAFTEVSRGTKKFKQSEYAEIGAHPIVDQGKEAIAGYSDEENGLFTDVPAIVFGDHTRCVKYVEEPFFAGADGVKILKPKLPGSTRFWWHALRATPIEDLGYSRHFKLLKAATFKVINETRQEEVVACLDGVLEQISYAEDQLTGFDSLVKSRFVEMFGDPKFEPDKWAVKPLGDVCATRLGKMLDAKKQTGECPYPYLANANVQWFRFELSNLRHMDFPDEDRIEFALNNGDVLVTEGGEVGRCAVWRGELKDCYFQKAVHRVRCDTDCLSPEYFVWCFKMKSDLGLFEPYISRSTIAHLTGKKIKQVPIPLPPLTLQQEFASFASQVDKSRFIAQQQIEKLQMLYNSLAQDYFGD